MFKSLESAGILKCKIKTRFSMQPNKHTLYICLYIRFFRLVEILWYPKLCPFLFIPERWSVKNIKCCAFHYDPTTSLYCVVVVVRCMGHYIEEKIFQKSSYTYIRFHSFSISIHIAFCFGCCLLFFCSIQLIGF